MPEQTPYLPMICSLLCQLGVTANYVGFSYVSCAVLLVIQEPDCLLLATKLLYPEIAKRYKVTWKSVERSIRSVVSAAWERNPALLEKLAMHPLLRKPTPTQFISILALYVATRPHTAGFEISRL